MLVVASAHREAARHGPRVDDGRVSPHDGWVGEELGPTLGRNRTRVHSVQAQEAKPAAAPPAPPKVISTAEAAKHYDETLVVTGKVVQVVVGVEADTLASDIEDLR